MFNFGQTITSMWPSSVTIGSTEFVSGDKQKTSKSFNLLNMTITCLLCFERIINDKCPLFRRNKNIFYMYFNYDIVHKYS